MKNQDIKNQRACRKWCAFFLFTEEIGFDLTLKSGTKSGIDFFDPFVAFSGNLEQS